MIFGVISDRLNVCLKRQKVLCKNVIKLDLLVWSVLMYVFIFDEDVYNFRGLLLYKMLFLFS